MNRGYDGPDDPLWFKDAVVYELHVRAFHDTAADGVGDFRGLTAKLDYLKDLGINTVWLLPFYPSPLRDDGYDTADYTSIHPMYGNMADFRQFLREAHARGLRVITELVLNHTSDQHPWFQRARKAPPGSAHRNFYVWSDTQDRYREARIIFKDFEVSNWTWDPLAKAYFWHRFYSHQPDLNFDNPEVHKALFQAVDFWLEMGVDGLRLDAVPYLFEREGTSCENLPETHAFLRKLRQHVDENFRNRLLLAEANQWPEDAIAYFGKGDECHMAFHFPVMPRMFMAVHMEDRHPVVEILTQTPAIPESSQWALFLRNHDELTLEMVTDEERDYMYRVYAHDRQARINLGIRRRLAPLLRNNRRKIELLNGLLFSLPGTPVIYYGDEIGMGDNIYLGDRNGVRTPMQWSADRNAGFSRANPQKLYLPIHIDPEYHYEAVNVEAQQDNPHSLLWWMKRLISLSRRFKAFGRGSLEFLHPENRKVLAYLRRHEGETILVVANLSRFPQFVELDLRAFKEHVPVELFGRTDFPPIGELPYLLTLGPHAFYWFILRASNALPAPGTPERVLEGAGAWTSVFDGRARGPLEEALSRHLSSRRWFGAKSRPIKAVSVMDVVELDEEFALVPVQVDFVEGDRQIYALYLGFAVDPRAAQIRNDAPGSIVSGIRLPRSSGVLYDAVQAETFRTGLLAAIARKRQFRGRQGRLVASPTRALRTLYTGPADALPATVPRGEQSNTSMVFGDRLVLKLLRRWEPGPHPDVEMGRFLAEVAGFPNSPPVAGTLEYQGEDGESCAAGLLTAFIPNQGDAWSFTLDALGRYFEEVRSRSGPLPESIVPTAAIPDLVEQVPPPELHELVGSYLETARLMGHRTAEMHAALASGTDDPAFAPEPFTPFYQRSIYQSMRNQVGQVFPLLQKLQAGLPENVREDAGSVLKLEKAILRIFHRVVDEKMSSLRIRCHGDFHLGQLLYTGKDFFILDFEGQPSRPLGERRIKRSPLRDVAGMLRSFHYAAYAALFAQEEMGEIPPEGMPALDTAARLWHAWVGSAFLKAYLERAAGATFIPASPAEFRILLDALVLEKTVYELGYELNHRPAWIRIPLQGLLQMRGLEG